jgi:hypothetical protein
MQNSSVNLRRLIFEMFCCCFRSKANRETVGFATFPLRMSTGSSNPKITGEEYLCKEHRYVYSKLGITESVHTHTHILHLLLGRETIDRRAGLFHAPPFLTSVLTRFHDLRYWPDTPRLAHVESTHGLLIRRELIGIKDPP